MRFIKIVSKSEQIAVRYSVKRQFKPGSNPDWTLTVETLLDKLQHVEGNSLTRLHKRGQNPHGESHNRASGSNEAVWLNQSSRWITTKVQLTPCRITCQWCFAVEWFYIHIIYHIVLSRSALSIPTTSLTPTHTHTLTHMNPSYPLAALAGVCFI